MIRKVTFAILVALVLGISIFVGHNKYAHYAELATSKKIELESYREKDGTYNFRRDYDSKEYSYLDRDMRESMKWEDLRRPDQIKQHIKEVEWHANLQMVFAILTWAACSVALFILLLRKGSIVSSIVDSTFLIALIPVWLLYNERFDHRYRSLDLSEAFYGIYLLIYSVSATIVLVFRAFIKTRQPNQAL